eukprot:m.252141 g.252141  ORF g.252141 m.252141 type:complete len:389 (-) comp33902_c0_seq8:1036-2202(-)
MDRSKIFSNLDPTLEFQQNSRFAQKWHVDWTMYLREEWCTGTLLCETFSWMFPWCAKLLTLNESKEYARFAESNGCDDDGQELPIRWAAIEVLVDSTFSVQTDVWAFGVFVWEVFSNGATPFAHMSLIEVVAHVKTGGLLPRLSEAMCSVDVTDLIIEACMSPFPASRPTFRALYSDLIFFGGSEDDVAIQESKKRRMRANADAPEILSCEEKLSRQGPSVHHLQTTFLSGVLNAVESELASFDGLTQASDAAIFHMVKAYAKPTGEFVTCPRDGMVGAAYVDTLNGMDNVGLATALLSYSWGYKVHDVVDALTDWAVVHRRDPKRTYIWICSLCLNQHRIAATLSPEQLAKEFGERVESIGRVLPMLENWQNPGYVKRAWCLFEYFV